MKFEIAETVWLDERQQFTLMEFLELSGLSAAELQHLVDCEALSPANVVRAAGAALDAVEDRFSAHCLALARSASRLRDDFDLDENGLTLTLRLLDRIRELESELNDLRAQLPRAVR